MSAKKPRTNNSYSLAKIQPSGNKEENIYTQIFAVARAIPKGKVTSYGAIARAIGSGKSARLVGWAMHHCAQVKPKVPAHRVVNSAGLLTGKHAFETPTRMQELLEKEGIRVKNDKVIDFKKYFWDPLKEMGL